MLAALRGRVGRLVMSDWGAARDTERAGNAALDLVMPGPDGPWGAALVDAVRDGRVSEAAVDEKVRRLLRLAERVGALGEGRAASAWSDEEIASELRATAAAGIVLARNHGTLLPLGPLRTVAVLGPNAAVARTLGGGSATVFPVLHGVAAGRAARGAGRRGHVRARRSHVHAAARGRRRSPRLRYLAADGRELCARAARDRRVRVDGDARRSVAAIELPRPCAPSRPAST